MGNSDEVTPTETDLLEELAAALYVQPILPNDVTIAELADRLGISLSTVEDRMKPFLTSGTYTRHWVMGRHGRGCWAYRRGSTNSDTTK